MKRNYPRFDPLSFGRDLLTTGDLDPVYIALNRSGFNEAQVLRWLVAYAAYYHCGVASWLSEREGQAFWDGMMVAAKNIEASPAGGRWPRGHERRHFRGGTAEKAVAIWAQQNPKPEFMFPDIVPKPHMTVKAIMASAQRYYSVGTWLAFKIADLADACMGREVDQSDTAPFLYDTPRESLVNMWVTYDEVNAGRGGEPVPETQIVWEALTWLRAGLDGMTIPHKPGKPLDMFCFETIACKHASHLSGHYPMMNDIVEINHGLGPWMKVSGAAIRFRAAMPEDEFENPPFVLC